MTEWLIFGFMLVVGMSKPSALWLFMAIGLAAAGLGCLIRLLALQQIRRDRRWR